MLKLPNSLVTHLNILFMQMLINFLLPQNLLGFLGFDLLLKHLGLLYLFLGLHSSEKLNLIVFKSLVNYFFLQLLGFLLDFLNKLLLCLFNHLHGFNISGNPVSN